MSSSGHACMVCSQKLLLKATNGEHQASQCQLPSHCSIRSHTPASTCDLSMQAWVHIQCTAQQQLNDLDIEPCFANKDSCHKFCMTSVISITGNATGKPWPLLDRGFSNTCPICIALSTTASSALHTCPGTGKPWQLQV